MQIIHTETRLTGQFSEQISFTNFKNLSCENSFFFLNFVQVVEALYIVISFLYEIRIVFISSTGHRPFKLLVSLRVCCLSTLFFILSYLSSPAEVVNQMEPRLTSNFYQWMPHGLLGSESMEKKCLKGIQIKKKSLCIFYIVTNQLSITTSIPANCDRNSSWYLRILLGIEELLFFALPQKCGSWYNWKFV